MGGSTRTSIVCELEFPFPWGILRGWGPVLFRMCMYGSNINEHSCSSDNNRATVAIRIR